jgi:hypothetical protein
MNSLKYAGIMAASGARERNQSWDDDLPSGGQYKPAATAESK